MTITGYSGLPFWALLSATIIMVCVLLSDWDIFERSDLPETKRVNGFMRYALCLLTFITLGTGVAFEVTRWFL